MNTDGHRYQNVSGIFPFRPQAGLESRSHKVPIPKCELRLNIKSCCILVKSSILSCETGCWMLDAGMISFPTTDL